MLTRILRTIGLLPAEPVFGGRPRDPRWPGVRREHLRREPACRACGSRRNLQVHHKQPYHLFPELELERKNLITLCEEAGSNHHLVVGHRGDWHDYNPNVEADADRMMAESKR